VENLIVIKYSIDSGTDSPPDVGSLTPNWVNNSLCSLSLSLFILVRDYYYLFSICGCFNCLPHTSVYYWCELLDEFSTPTTYNNLEKINLSLVCDWRISHKASKHACIYKTLPTPNSKLNIELHGGSTLTF
jgi:hypothetical protein